MFFQQVVPFIKDFIEEINKSLSDIDKNHSLSKTQRIFLGTCLMGILVTNSICWSKFYRASLGLCQVGALSWMFRQSKIFWELLLMAGILVILDKYKLKNGILILDDSDKSRSKNTTRIFKVHKIFDKKTSGYFKGQCILLLLLVTDKVTIPVGFRFYHPDPILNAWEKNDAKLKAAGVPKKQRPTQPERDPKYPSKSQLGQELICEFKKWFPKFIVKAVIADAFYGSAYFIDGVKKIYPKAQVISQLRCNQLVYAYGKLISVEDYFKRQVPVQQSISIRGLPPIEVWMHGARIIVDSHSQRRYVIALKYEGEDEYRYIVASDLGWRMKDIVETYSFRWLVEVFFQDWKTYEGWRELELQYVEGSERAAILSLLLDYSLLLHPAQIRVVESKLPAYTVGSLIEQSKVDAFLQFVRNVLESEEVEQHLSKFKNAVKEIYKLRPSTKHMSGRTLGKMESTHPLARKWEKSMKVA